MKKIAMRFALVFDDENGEAINYSGVLCKELFKRVIDYPIHSDKKIDLVIAIGGDGTMLRAKEEHWHLDVPLLGLNFGYKGFLMNPILDLKEVVDRIVGQQFKLYRFPLLKIETDRGRVFVASNDVYLNRIGGRNCRLNVTVNGIPIAERISGDGFIVSTALGSTGYNFGAGGSAIYPELSVISLTPVALHAPIQLRHMVFPLNSKIEIEVLNLHKKEIRGWYDGFELPFSKKMKISAGERWIKLAFWDEENFTDRLIKKLMKVQEA